MTSLVCKATHKRWVRLTLSEAAEYNRAYLVTCGKCLRYGSQLHFVHDPDDCGDYICPKDKQGCRLTGKLIYFCFKCKKSTKSEDED